MPDITYRTAAYVDLSAVRQNLMSMKASLPEGTGLMAVVKADAYGHGALPVSEAVQDLVSFFAVASADEAFALQDGGITRPILILGAVHDSYFHELYRRQLRPCVFSLDQARAISDSVLSARESSVTQDQAGQSAAGSASVLPVHIKVDTGMGRLGFPATEEGMDEAAMAARLPGLKAEGLFTHFATADEADKTRTKRQLELYEQFAEGLRQRGVEIPIHHVSNSAAILDMPGEGRSLVRAGIAMYGCYPSDEVDHDRVALKPALSWKSHIVFLKGISAGDAVSYGATYIADSPRRIATIPVGYADGYPRSLSNIGYVLIRGRRAPVRGRICMDQFMVDVTDIPDAAVGDEVTLIGTDGSQSITAQELGRLSGRFHYELLCDIGARVPRVYLRS